MAGLDYVPLYVTFPRGKEAIALGIALQKPRAWSYVAEMWCGVAQFAPSGRVEGPASVQQLEAWAGWDGAAGAFVEALCLPHIALLDITERGFYVHNWHLHCGAHIEKLKKDRDRKRESRKPKASRTVPGQSTDGPRTTGGQIADAYPSPSPLSSVSRRGSGGGRKRTGLAAPDSSPAKWPETAAVLAALEERGIDAAWPAEPATADRVERAIEEAGLPLAIDRAAASLAANPGKPWLGWHLDAIRGRASGGPQPVSQDFSKTLDDVYREQEANRAKRQ